MLYSAKLRDLELKGEVKREMSRRPDDGVDEVGGRRSSAGGMLLHAAHSKERSPRWVL
jgi:hypothetical protein